MPEMPIVIGDPKEIVNLFLKFNCDMLFESTIWFPSDLPELKCFEDNIKEVRYSRFKYLNAGFFIGRTNFVIEFLEEAAKYTDRQLTKDVIDLDQAIFILLHKKYYPKVKIDYYQRVSARIPFPKNRKRRKWLYSYLKPLEIYFRCSLRV